MLLTVVHNPSAGSGRVSADALVRALRTAGHEVAYHSRKAPGLEEAIARPADAIVLAGGDGTVGKLAHLLLDRGLPIAILPLGTANNLARSLGISGPVAEIAARWQLGRTRRLDVGIARGPWGERLFLDSAGAGAISQAMEEMDRADLPPGADSLAQARASIRRRVMEARPGAMEVIADGEPLPPDILLAEATLISQLGPRLSVVPESDAADGMLDLVFAREGDRAALAAWLSAETDEAAPLPSQRVRTVIFQNTAGPLRVGDAFEQSPGTGTVAETLGRALELLVS